MKKRVWLIAAGILILCGALYAPFMRIYVKHKMAPLTELLAQPDTQTYTEGYRPPSPRFLHAVNTVYRAQKKEDKYPGYEMDIIRSPQGELLVGHDASALPYAVTLADIFAALKAPQNKTYWLDLKTPLEKTDMHYLRSLAQRFGLTKEQFMFEAPAGETAQLLKQCGLSLLLQIPDGFDKDGQNAARRAQLNQLLADQLAQYKPQAVSASFGKYKYLQAYFPNVRKAIYYSSTKRPSLKKTFLQQAFDKDPSVIIFMTDEYTF